MDNFDKFYNKTLKFLSFRPRSEKEIRDYLNRKKAETSVIKKIIKTLKEQNFLNDSEFAKWWTEQRTVFKPRSSEFIKMELRQKGISEGIINSEIFNFPASRGEQFSIFNEKEKAKRIIEPKIHKYKDLPKQEIFRKLGSMLSRRGFSYDVIKQSIDETLKKVV